MRKLLFLLCLVPVMANAQIPGSKFPGPLHTKYGDFREGDTLKVGSGSNPNGDFKFIYKPPNAFVGTNQINLSKIYSNTRLIIKFFKEWESSTFGIKEYTVVGLSGLNGIVEIEPAIETGEIIVPGYTPGAKQVSQNSVADELLKFKKLLDAGAITQGEYEAQKKKLLGE